MPSSSSGRVTMPTCVWCGSTLTTVSTTSLRSSVALVYATSWSFSVGWNLRPRSCCSAGLARAVLAQLEGRTVHAVARSERRGKEEARGERVAAAVLQVLGEDVRRVRPQVRAHELDDRRAGDLAQVLRELPRGVAPREVGVRLAEARLGEAVHHLRPCERIRKEDDLGVLALDLGDEPVPERERLGVRVVDTQDLHALRHP